MTPRGPRQFIKPEINIDAKHYRDLCIYETTKESSQSWRFKAGAGK